MYISKLNLINFRNIDSLTINPGKHLNFITGHNGAGKTSILESIFILSQLKSFKVNNLNSVIQDKKEQTLIYAQVEDEFDNSNNLGLKISSKQKELFLNGEVAKNGVASLAQLLPIQIISPDVVELLTEGPEFRRKFIYWGTYYTYPNFLLCWRKFNDAHKSRNVLLKRAQTYKVNKQKVPQELIEECKVWGKILAQTAQEVNKINQEYIMNFLPVLDKVLDDFLPELEVKVSYYQGWNSEQDLATYYEENLEDEMQAGRTSLGLHRADLRIKCFGENVSNVLSRGQLKLLACALKIAQGDLLKEQTKSSCVYLVDDLAAELDEQNQLIFASKLLREKTQIFMSYIDNRVLDIFSSLVNEWNEFSISKGKLTHQYVNGEEIVQREFNLDDYI
ncbi:DNA replication/repair protein RecF [Psittacicella gerlachiana]|uniref:DNA replication/repair protein RecF n=1 Tax=Psittacicella gerlachiana TaxID=2028574 RepID=UPI001CA6BE9E|nr:DNA replication/repair protein RecF [Psittacicella gerlachiana]